MTGVRVSHLTALCLGALVWAVAPAVAQQTGTGLVTETDPDLAPDQPPISQGKIKSTESGFTDALEGSEPKRNKPYETIPPIGLPDPASARVVIWNHGTTSSLQREACATEGNAPPPSIRALEDDGVHIYFLCSQVAVRARMQDLGRYIYLRMEEVDATIRALTALGVPADQIYLAGHSAGGWTALMMAKEWGGRIGGIIAFAPAFAGRRDREDTREWLTEAQPRLIDDMKTAERMRALVYAYTDDAFNRPQELAFLTERWPDGVALIAYGCDPEADHGSHMNDCQAERTRAQIRRFVLGQR
ncbi:MAG: hypothetical protein AAFR46_04415 [Pseudomonadota bacterium]